MDKDNKILHHLITNKTLTKVEAQAVLSEQKLTGERIGNLLVSNGFVTRSQISGLLEDQLDPSILVNPIDVEEVDPKTLLDLRCMILAVTSDKVYVGTSSPRRYVTKKISPLFKGKSVEFIPYDPEILSKTMLRIRSQVDNLNNLDSILREAIISKSSDIHLVPKGDGYALMHRYNGVRKLVRHLSVNEGVSVTAQIKDRAKMDIAERRAPQDGSFRAMVVDRAVDFRIATTPTINGETVVARILDAERVNPSLDSLGMSKASVVSWRKAIGYTSGICLVVGPTGSGKSTTMNATIREMDRFGKAIYTVEDPVELQLAYLSQVETNPAAGLDFAKALRSFMRLDPDVIVVGEIRDQETARIAVNAAKTGHIVLATVHAESPAGAIERLELLSLSIDDFGSHLRGVLSQQLCRTLCNTCHGEDASCSSCGGSEYTGRQMMSECVHFENNEQVKDCYAGKRWWPSMVEDAERMIEEGLTDAKEAKRVLGNKFKTDEKVDS